jgi:hypothetical protein
MKNVRLSHKGEEKFSLRIGRIVAPARYLLPCLVPLFWGKEMVTLVTFLKGKKCAAEGLMSNELIFLGYITILTTNFFKRYDGEK